VNQRKPAISWQLVLIGVATGVLGGFFGVGGGIILVPLLVWIGYDRHRAHATSLSSFVIIAAVGAASFAIAGEIDIGAGIAVGVGGIVGSVIGASVMHRLSARTLAIVFAAILLVAGVRMISGAEPIQSAMTLDPTVQVLVAVAVGLISGGFAGLAGIGGGVVIVPAGVLLMGLQQHEAQGVSLLAIVMTAIAGSVVNLRNDLVKLQDSLLLGVGGAVGTIAGTSLALRLEGRTLSFAFGLMVVFVAFRTLLRTLRTRIVS
jgi:uncharacterized membrane protein YfcA